MKHPTSKIQELIDAEFMKPEFTVQTLAERLEISTTYLRDLSWRTYGMCPYDLIENRRLEQALSLLHDETLNLHTVCSQSGYTNPQTLRDAFKKRFGETPADIRLRLHEERRTMNFRSYLLQLKNMP